VVLRVRHEEGGTVSPLHALIDASRRERAASSAARSLSARLCQRAEIARRDALEARLSSRPPSRYAIIEGVVDGRPSLAVVHRDGSVVAAWTLLRRVELVVSLGDTFDEGRKVASIGRDPLATTLAAARACDSVKSIDLCGARAPHRGPAGGREPEATQGD
jgi:hypothetical protein